MGDYVASPGSIRMGVQLPSIRPTAMWAKAWFVDYDSGSNGNVVANDPGTPLKTLTGALSAAARGDVIYLRPRPYSGTDPQGILDNAVVPVAKGGIAIIGTGVQLRNPFDMQVKGAAAGAILTVRAPMVTIENICFNRGSGTIAHIKAESSSTDATKRGWGLNVFNCHFRNSNALAGAGGAIFLDNVWHVEINGCVFIACATGINATATVDSIHDVNILNCQFLSAASTAGDTAADIDCHVYMNVLSRGVLIDNCRFCGPVPTGLASAVRSRYMDLTGCLVGMVSNCFFNDTSLTFGAAGSGAFIPTTVGIVNCYQEGANNASPLVRT